MSEHMRGDVLADACIGGIAVYHEAHRLIRKPVPQSVYEKKSADINILLKCFLV